MAFIELNRKVACVLSSLNRLLTLYANKDIKKKKKNWVSMESRPCKYYQLIIMIILFYFYLCILAC